MEDDALARLYAPRHLIAELTSRCNLRCRYCQKASDKWNAEPGRDEDLPQETLDEVFSALKKMPFRTVQLSGIGEFTFRNDWTTVLDRFRELGTTVTLISNFAKPFSDDELGKLLDLKHLMVSIDTVDAAVLRSVRRSVSLANIVTNLVRLRLLSRRSGRRLPFLKLNAVLYRENMLGIEDLAHFALEMRVNEMQYERMFPQTDLRPPYELKDADAERAREALRQIEQARQLLRAGGIAASFHGDLVQVLEARAQS